MAVATNMQYVEAYNEYLQTHNLVEARQNFTIPGTVVGIDTDMFIDYLLDEVAMTIVRTKGFADPLEFLYKEDIGVGRIIKDIRTIMGTKDEDYNIKTFEVDVTNPFAKNKAKTMVVFHKVNEYKKAMVTTSFEQLMSAFGYEGGINDLVRSWVADLRTQFNAYWYNKEKEALTDPNWLTKIYFDDYADFSVKVKDTFADFASYDNSMKYNASLIPSPTQESDVVILIAKKYQNKLDVDYFTGLFNQSFAAIKGNIHYVDYFDDPNMVCVMFDSDGTQFRRQIQTARTLDNPADLTRNHWEHMWRMISTSPLYNAVCFYLNDPAVKRPTVSLPSGLIDSSESVTITQGEATNVTYSVNGNIPVSVTTSAQVTINESTVLTVKYDGGEDIYRYRLVD